MLSAALALVAALLLTAVAADTATSASGDQAAAFATDFKNSSYVKTGRRRLAQEPNLATSTSGNGFAMASGDGKTIGSSGGGGGGGGGNNNNNPCRAGNTATSGPNAFAWSSGGPGGPSFPFIDWGPGPGGAAAPAPLTVCPGTVLQFSWQGASPARGVTQVAGPACPAKFGAGAAKQKVIAPPAESGSVGVRVTKPGSLWFADPANCKDTITQVNVLKP